MWPVDAGAAGELPHADPAKAAKTQNKSDGADLLRADMTATSGIG